MKEAVMTSDQGNAFVALAARARGTSDARLVAVESAGLTAAIAVYLWIPERVILALPFLAFAMLGLWGVAEHVRNGRRASVRHPAMAAVAVLQLAAILVGTVAMLAALYAAVGRAIGTVIS